MPSLNSLKRQCRGKEFPPCNTTKTEHDVPQPVFTSSPIPEKGTQPRSSEKGNSAAFDLMFKFRQSKVRQESNPVVIDMTSCGRKRAAHNTTQSKKQQYGIPGFQDTRLGQCCGFNVEPAEFIQILHNGKDHWMTISTIGTNTPRCLSTVVCTLQHQTSYNSKSPPYIGEKHHTEVK